MTYPTSHSSYVVASASAQSLAPIFLTRDPTSHDTAYPIQQRWINLQTQGIWVLESFSSSNGVVTATWRALAPIVLKSTDPTSGVAGTDYLYPLGQPWLNTTTMSYWVLVSVSGTTPTWDELSAGGIGTVVTLTGDTGGAVPATAGNINTLGSGSITTIGSPGTSTITTELTGLTNHAVLVGAGTTTITKIAATTNTGAVLQNNNGGDPSYSTATYPSTTTINNLLFSSATNVVGQIANGTTGQVLSAVTGSAPIWHEPPSINTFQFSVAAAFSGNLYIAASIVGSISLMGVVGIYVFGTNYVQQTIVSVGANQFDSGSTGGSGRLSILSNYPYKLGTFTPPISDIFFSYDAAQQIYLTITLTTVPAGGATVSLTSFSPGSHITLGNFAPTVAGTMPGYGTKINSGAAFGFSGLVGGFGIDSHANTNNIYIQNAGAPTGTPVGGGIIYVEAGALKYIGSGGTTTILGVA